MSSYEAFKRFLSKFTKYVDEISQSDSYTVAANLANPTDYCERDEVLVPAMSRPESKKSRSACYIDKIDVETFFDDTIK